MTFDLAPRAQTLVSARLATYPPGTSFGPRLLTHHQFVWLLTGSARWQVDARSPVELTPGSLVLVRPGEVDRYTWATRTMTTHAYLHFDLTGPWPSLPDRRDFAEVQALAGLCDHLLDLPDEADLSDHRDRVLGTLVEIFARGSVARQQFGPLIDQMLGQVRMIWQRDGLRIIPTSELAAAAQISTGHVFRVFREQFGRGPAEVLELVRLSVATAALRRSNATVAEVAALCGYTNPFHFSRRFSTALSMPPGAYRALDQADPRTILRQAGLVEVARQVLDPRAT